MLDSHISTKQRCAFRPKFSVSSLLVPPLRGVRAQQWGSKNCVDSRTSRTMTSAPTSTARRGRECDSSQQRDWEDCSAFGTRYEPVPPAWVPFTLSLNTIAVATVRGQGITTLSEVLSLTMPSDLKVANDSGWICSPLSPNRRKTDHRHDVGTCSANCAGHSRGTPYRETNNGRRVDLPGLYRRLGGACTQIQGSPHHGQQPRRLR